MGILGKLLNAAGTMLELGADVAENGAKSLKAKNERKKQLARLDAEWGDYLNEYKEKAALLKKRVDKKDRKAFDLLDELEEEFKIEEQKYQIQRGSLLGKLGEEKKGSKKDAEDKLETNKRINAAVESKDTLQLHNDTQCFFDTAGELICSSCGSKNNSSAKFCSGCGEQLNVKKFCVNCGMQIDINAKFCSGCGSKVTEIVSAPQIQQADLSKQRKQFFDGEIHKCPSCGEVLNSFMSHCSSCGYELRGVMTANSIQELVDKIENCPSEKRLIEIIRNFPIPNTKEDILEFMVLAASNFDVKYYKSHLNEEDVSDAWLSKIEQCYKKAKTLLNAQDLKGIEETYNEVHDKIDPMRKAGRFVKGLFKKEK